jgi:hypothetical protein
MARAEEQHHCSSLFNCLFRMMLLVHERICVADITPVRAVHSLRCIRHRGLSGYSVSLCTVHTHIHGQRPEATSKVTRVYILSRVLYRSLVPRLRWHNSNQNHHLHNIEPRINICRYHSNTSIRRRKPHSQMPLIFLHKHTCEKLVMQHFPMRTWGPQSPMGVN